MTRQRKANGRSAARRRPLAAQLQMQAGKRSNKLEFTSSRFKIQKVYQEKTYVYEKKPHKNI